MERTTKNFSSRESRNRLMISPKRTVSFSVEFFDVHKLHNWERLFMKTLSQRKNNKK